MFKEEVIMIDIYEIFFCHSVKNILFQKSYMNDSGSDSASEKGEKSESSASGSGSDR